MSESNIVQIDHFIATQIQVLLLFVPITFGLTYKNKMYNYFLYCLPVLFLLMGLEYIFIWRKQRENKRIFNIFNCLLFIICLPIFFGLYFGIYYETTSMQFERVEDCKVTGKMSTNIEKNENYSLLYVDFQYQGKQYLGYACQSNQSQGHITETLHPNSFLYYGDSVKCNSNKNQTEYETTKTSKSGASTKSKKLNLRLNDSLGDCSYPYTFSKVKLASWFCIDNTIDIESLMESNVCYVNFFKNEKQAKLNSLNREYLRRVYHFPLISFQNPSYFPKLDITLLIIFTYYPMLLSLNGIFKFTADALLFLVKEIVFAKQEAKQETKQ